jgi:hypothetical protein
VGAAPVPPRRTWRAITLATLLLVPAYWALLAGVVSNASDGDASVSSAPSAGPLIAFGLCLIPFVFIALAFLSEHPRPPVAVLKAMGWSILVGIPVSALAGDAVTGMVAGVGAGGIAALRRGLYSSWRSRALAVLAASASVWVLVHTVVVVGLLLAPALPFTSVGVADHLSERRHEKERRAAGR